MYVEGQLHWVSEKRDCKQVPWRPTTVAEVFLLAFLIDLQGKDGFPHPLISLYFSPFVELLSMNVSKISCYSE